tara:strand:- start:563 stop:1963 length:1401 start_codon:yes stop_codon:yes gene_type:complete
MAGTLKVDTISNLAATGYIGTEGASLDLSNSNHSLVLPTGGTGTRPASPKAGAMRYNSDTNLMEYYNGTEWLNTDGSKNDTQQHRYLVWTGAGTQNTGAPNGVQSPIQRTLSTITATQVNAISYVPVPDFPTGWNKAIFTSKNRPQCQWVFTRGPEVERWLNTLCNPYSNWSNYSNTNSTYAVYPAIGSCSRVNQKMNFQHNNGGGESYDISTLGYPGTVWSTGMVWGQIDSPGNYAGWMNHAYTYFSGSGGGNTGDTCLIYVDTDTDLYGTAEDYVNYLTPNGPLGNAQTFPTGYAGSTSGGWGNVSNVFSGNSHTTSSGWPSRGFQLNGNNCNISVDFGTKVRFDWTWGIGYANGSHWGNQNFVDGSNDNSSWDTITEWRYHNGSNDSGGQLYYNSGGHMYSNTVNNMSKWHPMQNYPDPEGYRYYRWRAQNCSASNNYFLPYNWGLMKRKGYKTVWSENGTGY